MRAVLAPLALSLVALGCSDPDSVINNADGGIDTRCASQAGPGAVSADYLAGQCIVTCDPGVAWTSCRGVSCDTVLHTDENCTDCGDACWPSSRCRPPTDAGTPGSQLRRWGCR